MTIIKRIEIMLGPLALAAASLLVIAADVNSAHGADPGVPFHRGIGISQVMNWARVEPGPAMQFAFPPFPEQSQASALDEMRTLQRTGFDFVRLAVDPGPFLQFQGQHRDALDRILMDRVNLILAAGLAVIVDFHPSEAHADYTAKVLTAGVGTPIFPAYLRLLARTADLLDGLNSDRVALDLMNEPPVHPAAWQPMLEAAYAAVRHRSSRLRLVLESGEEASATALLAMRTAAFAGDPAVLFSFHYYDPYQFTHQGAPWNDARHLADVPYPALARPLTESLAATAAAIAKTGLTQPQKILAYRDAQSRLEDYRRSGFDRGTIDRTFDRVADWARTQGVPPSRVLLGEFGARETELQAFGSRAAEHAQWLRDVRQAAEAHGFRWAVWTYRDTGGFALVSSETSNEIKPAFADALGLKSAPHAEGPLDHRSAASAAKQ